MGNSINNSINHKQTYEIGIVSTLLAITSSGTFNGIATTNATVSNTNLRWVDQQLWDTFDDSIQLQYKLPLTYVAGTPIKILVDWHSTLTVGDVKYTVGIGGIDSGNQWASDSDNTYGTSLISTTPGIANAKKTDEWTFNVTDFVAGENIVIIVYRQATVANVTDTLATHMRISTVRVKYLVDKIGTTNII